MTDFGGVGRERAVVISYQLDVWHGTPVSFRVTSGHSQSYSVPNLLPKIGSLSFPELFMAEVDNSSNPAKIVEVVSKLGIPQKLKVRLYDRATGRLVMEKLSEDNGVVTFNYLNTTNFYTLIALDPESVYNADVLDLRKPLV